MSTNNALKSADQVRAEFEARGETFVDWAKQQGYTANLVYEVLSGRSRCRRGKSHQIAVKLGLKHGTIPASAPALHKPPD